MGQMKTLTINGQTFTIVSPTPIASITLPSSAWIGEASPYSQVVSVNGITENSQVNLTPTVDQNTIFSEKNITFTTENDGGIVTIYVFGQKPTNDYTIPADIVEVAHSGSKIYGITIATPLNSDKFPGGAVTDEQIAEAVNEYLDENPIIAEPGKDGTDGVTPHIGDNGNWFIGDTDTGNPSRGTDGKDGYTPIKGVDYFDGKDGSDGNDGQDGYTPRKNIDYFDGEDGQPGKDGYTPVKGVDYFDGKDGYTPQKGIDYVDGKDGVDGQDGVSPVVSVSAITGGHRITIADKNGAKTVDVMDGVDGQDGEDGTSPTHSWSGTTLTITSASGTSSANLKGEKGDKGDSIKGDKGDPGANGTSVTVKSVSESAADGGSNTVTFSDDKTLTVRNGKAGAAGKTPERGVDYWTPADMETIIQQMLNVLGSPIVGNIDANKHITLSGDLANGTYQISFVNPAGDLTSIGKLEIGGVAYTNQLPISTDASGAIYNGKGWKENTRLSGTGTDTADTTYGMAVTGFIPCGDTATIRIKSNVAVMNDYSNQGFCLYDASKTFIYRLNLAAITTGDNKYLKINDDGSIEYSLNAAYWGDSTAGKTVGFIRATFPGINDNTIVTINEEIV